MSPRSQKTVKKGKILRRKMNAIDGRRSKMKVPF